MHEVSDLRITSVLLSACSFAASSSSASAWRIASAFRALAKAFSFFKAFFSRMEISFDLRRIKLCKRDLLLFVTAVRQA
jgi:hypothetical protein